MIEKITNTFLGIAIGDAYGAGLEFQCRHWIKKNVDFSKFVNLRKGKWAKNYQPWNYTDDTEMSIALTNALMDPKPFEQKMLVDHFFAEYNSDKAKKGYGREGHGSIQSCYNGEKTIEQVKALQAKKSSPGNAPAMRSVPLGFVKEKFIDSYAIINADSTHPHPKARAASIIVARAAQFLTIKEGRAEQIIKYVKEYVAQVDSQTHHLLEEIDSLPTFDRLKQNHYKILCGQQPLPKKNIYGLPCDAMRTAACVLYIIKFSPNAYTGLKESIRLGGDVDSVASICTGILSGRYGLDSLPNYMLENVEGKERLTRLAKEFAILKFT